jgi:hypothetical protein
VAQQPMSFSQGFIQAGTLLQLSFIQILLLNQKPCGLAAAFP